MELLHASHDDDQTLAFPLNDRSFGFHAQQSVEKLLKILITAHGEEYDFTHSIAALVNAVLELGESIPVKIDLIENLTTFAGVWRYQAPDPLMPQHRADLLENIATLRAHVLQRLLILRPGVDWLTLEHP